MEVHPTLPETTDVICSLVNENTVVSDEIPIELLKITLNNSNPAKQERLLDIVTIKILYKRIGESAAFTGVSH